MFKAEYRDCMAANGVEGGRMKPEIVASDPDFSHILAVRLLRNAYHAPSLSFHIHPVATTPASTSRGG